MAAVRNLISRVSPKKSALFVCDMQEKSRPHIACFNEVAQICKRLIDAAVLMDLKIFATEQHSGAFGHIVPELELSKYKIPVFEKEKFSMCIPPVLKNFENQYESIILCGLESHACILQTALDLLEMGIQVHVVADAVSSRSQTDRLFSLRQMERAGAVITTSESVILSLVGGSDHPKFEEIKQILLKVAPDTGLLGDFSH